MKQHGELFAISQTKPAHRNYSPFLTVDINDKGVLDVDTVKGCTAGMSARPETGCYGGCYAAKIAKFRGLDFTQSVTRKVYSKAQARDIERKVAAAPHGFFRIGVMGDPCHAWEETVETIEWLCEFARPVVITKHWRLASDAQLDRLVKCCAVLNTSISALDTASELKLRKREFYRFKLMGGDSIARIVSCDFNENHAEGAKMSAIQKELFALQPTLDNPLRVPRTHPLVTAGIIKLSVVKDLETERTISLVNRSTYLGHCAACPDTCGVALVGPKAIVGSHNGAIKSMEPLAEYTPHNPRQMRLKLK